MEIGVVITKANRKSIKKASVLFFSEANGSWLAFLLMSVASAQDCMSEITLRAFSPGSAELVFVGGCLFDEGGEGAEVEA